MRNNVFFKRATKIYVFTFVKIYIFRTQVGLSFLYRYKNLFVGILIKYTESMHARMMIHTIHDTLRSKQRDIPSNARIATIFTNSKP